MPEENVLLVKTASEIALKSAYVENYFLRKLRENIHVALKKNNLHQSVSIRKLRGRLVIEGKNLKKIERILEKIFGIHSIIFATRFDAPAMENIVARSVEFSKSFLKRSDSFAVRARRSGQQNFSSHDLNVAIGAAIQNAVPGLKVNLDNPKKELFVEVQQREFFLYKGEKPGLRGLPLGVEGNVAFFFAGKKKELLAAWLLMKRGCNIFPVLKNKKALGVIKKLVQWNSWRSFQLSKEKDLPALLKERNILALGTADDSVGVKDLAHYKDFDEKFSLPVLRPLLLLPKKELRLPKGL